MSKVTLLDVATRLFGYYLFNRKDAKRIKELEDRLYESETLLKDVAFVTDPNKVGGTLECAEGVVETAHYMTSSYCRKHGINYEEV